MLALLAALATQACAARDRNILWTVQGAHNTVYLLGSIHVLRPGDGGLPPAAEAAYADAEQLVMEIDLDDPASADPAALLQAMQRTALLPEGTSLREVLGGDYASIEGRARQAGVDLAVFDRFAPWLVAVTLMQLELAKRGFAPDLGIEHSLASRASKDGKAIAGLETPEQQFAAMGGLT
ncbi:MAG TPA: TraB/GumN family protein, partial [Pseudomonadales bacterium]|nr:TraB/GumN family protein [Pseudomonadales bacterium]